MTTTFPEGTIQSMVDEWWVDDPTGPFCRGRLVKIPAVMVGQVPHELIPEGRGEDPRDHSHAKATLGQFHIGRKRSRNQLPVAGLPRHPGEVYLAYKAKVRPGLIIGKPPPNVGGILGSGTPKSHRTSPVLVAPYYGATQDGSRSGYPQGFVERAQRAEFPQYMWDNLPLPDDTESILRLDHMQPVGRNVAACKPTQWRLSDDALELLGEWVAWLLEGEPREESNLRWLREELLALE